MRTGAPHFRLQLAEQNLVVVYRHIAAFSVQACGRLVRGRVQPTVGWRMLPPTALLGAQMPDFQCPDHAEGERQPLGTPNRGDKAPCVVPDPSAEGCYL
jgi:hypothetical protein